MNEKPSVISDYEGGRAIPSPQILAKLERTLGVKLRGECRFSSEGLPLCAKSDCLTSWYSLFRLKHWREARRAEEVVN